MADQVDGPGQFGLMLALAWHTSRRINAICHLRRPDIFLGRDEVRRALAAAGEDESVVEEWGNAIRWRAEWDKKGYLTFSPMPKAVLEDVRNYLRRNPCIGEAWVFPFRKDASRPQTKAMANYWLNRAEGMAGLAHLHRGGYHAYRRGWASARKHLPVQDVMAAGGWRDAKALQVAYQGADARTTRQVVDLEFEPENDAGGHEKGTAKL